MNQNYLRILKLGFLTGTLDLLSAFMYVFIKTGSPHMNGVLKFIASGLFGKAAIDEGGKMILAGLFLHYFIACIFTAFFLWVFPKVPIASKNSLITAMV